MLFRYFLNGFETVRFADIKTGITLVVTIHMRSNYVLRSLDFKIFWALFLDHISIS
jgi:hypothetical protein